MDLSALGYIVGGLVAATKASQSPQLYTAVRTGIYLTHDQIYTDLGDYWGGPFLRACFFLRCEDQKRAPSLSYLYVVCDKKGSLLLGCDLGKAPD